MGPRHDGRGKRHGAVWMPALPQGFNGATPRWAWKTYQAIMQRYGLTQLQWGHATMGVENAGPGPGRSRPPTGFNGATPRWAWKTALWRIYGVVFGISFNGATPR